MGTNFYLHPQADCECCGRPFEPLHIGKSSAGWCFSLHVIPEEGINTLDDWRKLWKKSGAIIRNEYGDQISVEEMEAKITDRSSAKGYGGDWWRVPFNPGYSNEEDFHRRNHSERGPNGMLRHRVDNRHCIGHGPGTYDYIAGEFS